MATTPGAFRGGKVSGPLWFGEDVAAADTDEELIPAPGPGKFIRVFWLAISSPATPSSVTFGSAGTPFAPTYNNSIVLTGAKPAVFECGINEALTVDTGAGSGPTGITGTYEIVG